MSIDRNITLITSNTGTLFGKNRKIYEDWSDNLKNYIKDKNPDIAVISLQEFGGKTPLAREDGKSFMKNVYKSFADSFPIFIAFVDCDILIEENFTALATIFLVKRNTYSFELFDFQHNCFTQFVDGCHIIEITNSGKLCVKEKFPINLFPNEKWSRKGYLLNRIRINKKSCADIVNLHLIHDSNCYLAVEDPKYFSNFRKSQLEHILKKLDNIGSKSSILCGDFNFRTSIADVFCTYKEKYTIEKDDSDLNDKKLRFLEADGDVILASATTKEFRILEKFYPSTEEVRKKHKSGDKELEKLNISLFELPIHFLPTYCYSVKERYSKFDEKRLPSWCDRILFKGSIADRLSKEIETIKTEYEALFLDLVIGDHKPVSVVIPMNLIVEKENPKK